MDQDLINQAHIYLEETKHARFYDLNQQLDASWVKKNKLPFARAGVFNPYTLADWEKIGKRMAVGIPPQLDREFWFLDRWLGHPTRLVRTRGTLARQSRIKWSFTAQNSQLYLTPHGVSRFRERSGYMINPNLQCWNIPHITTGVDFNNAGKTITSQMLPTVGGAWLGYNTITPNNGKEVYKWSRSKGLVVPEQITSDTFISFYALTYITESMMSNLQIDACRAYDAGDYHRFDELNKKNWLANPNSIF